MVETNYSFAIKNLFQEYYKRNISMGEYRAQRKKIIDQMDEAYNGSSSVQKENNSGGNNSSFGGYPG